MLKKDNMDFNQKMFELAKSAMQNAYAPYSNFAVGTAVMGCNGKIYAGCNVENAAYPQGNCAEAAAISAMVLDGVKVIKSVMIIGDGNGLVTPLVTPCGGCRQRIREFANDDITIDICDYDGLRQRFSLGQLLPFSFGPENLNERI